MRRGEIRWVNLEPVRGSESNKTRPVVIVSNNGANAASSEHARGVITVVPLTSNVEHVRRFQVFVPAEDSGLQVDSKAQAEQIRSVDVQRIGSLIGHLSTDQMRDVDSALKLHLAL